MKTILALDPTVIDEFADYCRNAEMPKERRVLLSSILGELLRLGTSRCDAFQQCANYVFKLHLENRPSTGAIDALKTAYDQFIAWSKAP